MGGSLRLIGVLVLLAVLVVASHFRELIRRELLFAVEVLALLLLVYGVMLIRRMRMPLNFLSEGLEQLRQSDFTTRYRQPGLPELDELVGVYNELIERLQQERLQVGEALGLFRSLLDVTAIGVVILDFDGRPTVINPAARRWLELDNEQEVPDLTALSTRIGRELSSLGAGQDRLVALAGGRRVRLRQGSFKDRGFDRSYFLIEELTGPLEKTEREVWERLIRAVAHEVNNTLGAASSLLEGCREDLAEADHPAHPQVIDTIEVVRERNRRLVAFVKRYASLIKTRELDRESVDLGALIRVTSDSLAPAMREVGATLERSIPEEAPEFRLDGDLMQQALSNILLNAIEACSEGDKITIDLFPRSGGWVLRIADSADALPRDGDAFKPFHTTKAQGQGIGLMLVRDVLRRHNIEHELISADGMTQFNMSLQPDLVIKP